MNPIPGEHDIVLAAPMSDWLLRVLLFLAFEMHLLFVLFMLGLAILAGFEWARGGSPRRVLRTFTSYKSLAVVLGIGPLLLMMVLEPVPMLRAINLVAPGWLLLILLMITGLGVLELAKSAKRPLWRGVALVTGAGALLLVPFVFAAMVVSAETPSLWRAPPTPLNQWPARLLTHWLLRVLHIFGAAAVFGAAVLLLIHPGRHTRIIHLPRWIETGIWFQIVVGVALLISVPHALNPGAVGTILVAIAALGLFAKRLADYDHSGLALKRVPMSALLLVLLTGMLLARQLLQDQVLTPVQNALKTQAVSYSVLLENAAKKFPPVPLDSQPIFAQPAVLYEQSCGFCHGGVANGQGSEAQRLAIPPEDLSAVRSSKDYIFTVLRNGVPGTAMPKFGYYSRTELERLIDLLGQFGLRQKLEPMPVEIPPANYATAKAFFRQQCALCHGEDGRGGPGRSLQPPAPDFTRYTLAPQRAFDIITAGYPGTAMSPYQDLPKEMRWALVAVVENFYPFHGTQ